MVSTVWGLFKFHVLWFILFHCIEMRKMHTALIELSQGHAGHTGYEGYTSLMRKWGEKSPINNHKLKKILWNKNLFVTAALHDNWKASSVILSQICVSVTLLAKRSTNRVVYIKVYLSVHWARK